MIRNIMFMMLQSLHHKLLMNKPLLLAKDPVKKESDAPTRDNCAAFCN